MSAAASEVWDRAADRYGRQEHLELRSVRRALELLAPVPGEAVLDVATGTGLVLRELARRRDRPVRAVGVDRSPGMLARVGPLPPGWELREGDATALPVAGGSFDVATCSYLLQLLAPAERAAVLGELRRVLRPGGRLVVVTMWSRPHVGRAALTALAAVAPATLGGLRPYDPRDGLRAAGFTVERGAVLRGGYPALVTLARA